MKKIIKLFALSILNVCYCISQVESFKYLGQAEPLDSPKVFNLPVNVGDPAERIAISSDYKEIYFTEINPGGNPVHKVKYYKYNGKLWTGPYVFCEKCNEYGPLFSPDNNMLLINGIYSIRNDTGWTAPVKFLENKVVHYLQLTNLGNYYFLSYVNDSTTDVFKVIINKQDTIVEPLGLNMKSKVLNDYYIEPDETFILTSLNNQEIKCYGGKDIFIRFRTKEGWTNPINLGKHINTELSKTRFGMCLSPDKKYMFYTQIDKSGVHIYWVKVDELFKQLKENIDNM
jgi:hypothetical protein